MLGNTMFKGALGASEKEEILAWKGPDPDAETGSGLFQISAEFLEQAQAAEAAEATAKKKANEKKRNTILLVGGVAAAGLLIYFVSRR